MEKAQFCRVTFDKKLKNARAESERIRPFRIISMVVVGLFVLSYFVRWTVPAWVLCISFLSAAVFYAMEVATQHKENAEKMLQGKNYGALFFSYVLYLFIALMLLFYAIGLFGDVDLSGVLFYLSLLPPIIFAGVERKAWKKVDELMRDGRVIRDVLEDTFEVIEYERHKLVEKSLLEEGRFNYCWDSRFNRDYIRAKYRGVEFTLLDVELSVFRMIMGSRSSRTAEIIIFKGPWLIIHSPKEIHPAVIVSQKKSRKAKKGEFPAINPLKTKSDVQMENIAFQEKFWTFSDDPVMPYRVLTPHFMEFILSAREIADAAKHLCFTGNHIHVAVHNGRDLFTFSKKVKSYEDFRASIEKEIHYVKAIIDELLQNEQLFDLQQ